MGIKVSKAVFKALEPFKGLTRGFQSRDQLADALCGSCNSTGGGHELWMNIVKFLEDKGVILIEDVTFEEGRKVRYIKVTVDARLPRLSREDLHELNGLRRRPVEVNRSLGYVHRPMMRRLARRQSGLAA